MEKSFGKRSWYILLLFGLIGQIAWSVENMFFNVFLYEQVDKNLHAVTLMVQLSGITATLVTLLAGTLSDKLGNRRSFLSWGYIIWGVTVALFGFLSAENVGKLFGMEMEKAIPLALVLVVVADCIMTLFGSTANDAAFNAWVTDNTETEYRGKVEGILSILPLGAMLVVAGGFGILKDLMGYQNLFLVLGILISVCGIIGKCFVKDSPKLVKSGEFKDIVYGFKPSVIKSHKPLYVTLLIMGVYGIACQIFMPYLIIYMMEYLQFTVLEYSAVFALAIILGAGLNVYLTRLSDKKDKVKMLYGAAGIFACGLLIMYFAKDMVHGANLVLFGIGGFVMISGNILVAALTGSTVRDHTPEGAAGKLQGVRMIFSVLLPMVFGPMIGDAINTARNLGSASEGAVLTTSVIPAPEIFLAAAICSLLMFAIIPLLQKTVRNHKGENHAIENEV